MYLHALQKNDFLPVVTYNAHLLWALVVALWHTDAYAHTS